MNKTLKKILGVSALTAFAVAPVSAASFSDTANHWVAEYLDTAIEAGVIDGSKTNFLPEADISRAALTKMVVNYDNGGENPTATSYETAATFSDVSADAWYAHHVSYAAENGIIDGSKATFNPGTAITRAAALKVITVALGVPSDSTKALPFADVNEGDWYYSYVNDAYNNCIIKDATTFNPGAPITRAAATKILVKSLNPGCDAPVIPTEPTTPVDPVEPTEPTTPVVPVSTNTVEIVVNNSVEATDVPQGGSNADFLALDITAGSAEDVKLTGLTVFHTGHGKESDITDVKVFDGFVQRGSDKSFSGEDDEATINLGSEAIIIPAGTTKTIFVKADIETATNGVITGVSHGVQILSADGISLYGVSTGGKVAVSGSFPIAGPLRDIANFSVGNVVLTAKAISDTTLEVGSKAIEVAYIELSAGAEEDVWLKSLTVELDGVDDGDIANLFVELNGVVVSDVVASAVSDDVTFDLTVTDARGILIEDNSKELISIKADLTSSIDDFDDASTSAIENGFKVTIDDVSSDVIAIGARHGFEVTKTVAGSSTGELVSDVIAFEGGDFELTLDGETADIAADKDDVVLGTLTIENFGAEAEIQKEFALTIVGDYSVLENVSLVDTATGRTVFGPQDPTTGGLVAFRDTLIVASTSKLVLEIQADVKDTAAAGNTVKATIVIAEGIVKGGSDLDDASAVKLKPSTGIIAANVKTVALPSVTFASKSLSGDRVVEGTENVIVWQGTVRSSDVENIKITRLGFVNAAPATATASDVNNYSLFVIVDGEEVALETSVSSAAVDSPFIFASLKDGGLVVNAGDELTLVLRADIAAEAANNATIVVALDKTQTQAKDEDGDLLASETGTIPAGATFTIVDAGQFVVTTDASRTPDASIALAGEESVLAVYKLSASDEAIKIEDLVVNVTDASGSSVESVALYYQDPTASVAVLKVGGGFAVASVSNGEAFFEGLDLTVEEGTDTYLEVRALVDGIDKNDSQQTAVSGTEISVTLALGNSKTDVKGSESGTEIAGLVDTTGEATFLVLNNKVLASGVDLSSTTLASGTKEALKFNLDVKGDNEAYLDKVNVTIAGVAAGVVVENISLYEGGKLLAQAGARAAITAVTAVAAVAEVDTYTVAGDIVVGDKFTVAGKTYTVETGDILTTDAVAGKIDELDATFVAVGSDVVVTAPVAGTALDAKSSSVVLAPSTDGTITIEENTSDSIETVTIGGTPLTGDAFTLTVLTEASTVTLAADDSASDVAAALALEFTTNSPANATVTADGAVLTVTHNTANASLALDVAVVVAGSRTNPTITEADTTANVVEIAEVVAVPAVTALSDGINSLTIGDCGAETCDSSTTAGSVVIKKDATYVVKAKLAITGTDKSLSFEIDVNGADANATDGIEWIDYGTNGLETAVRAWIDLGNSSVTTISGTLSN